MDYNELINTLASSCIDELYAPNSKNLTALVKRQHKQDAENYKKIDPEKMSPDEVQRRLKNSVKEFKTREYAENKGIPLNCSVHEKAARIRECVGMMMDICPITVVGAEHPAKLEAEKKKKKKDKDK